MKKCICFLLMASLLLALCACVEREDTESETTSAKDASAAGAESSEETVPVESDTSTTSEESAPETDGVSYDEAGNVVLSDPPTYAEVLALHAQDPDTYRDPGELQPETKEMIQLEDGQWYQSFVASSYNCRYIIWNEEESEKTGWWSAAIGSAENAFLYNAGAMYDDPGGQVPYTERAVAVRGTLAEGTDGYAYQLQLPDELIVCLENTAGCCWFPETDVLSIPEAYASLLEDKTGEVVVTGVVMQDETGVFYLKNVELYP